MRWGEPSTAPPTRSFGVPCDTSVPLSQPLSLTHRMQEQAKERRLELGLRAGIHTGMVVAGSVRSVAEYGVMGDTVNTAQRIQAAAGPGEIYVSQASFRLTNREFAFREVGPIEIKGKEKPILVYALTGERSDGRPVIDVAAPLVGRWMELSRLDLAYQSCRLGHTEVVLVAGEPAIESEEWKRSMFLSVYDVIAAMARARPLLYILEDLHFADAASLDLLWFLASRASRVPILILLAQRIGPGAPEPRPSRTNFTQLVLEPLSDEEAARIVEATFDWIPDELRDRIVARAGGNPFFIEESLRSLVESGAIARDEAGEWRLRDRPSVLE